MTERVRQADVEKANKKAYWPKRVLRFYDVLPAAKNEEKQAVSETIIIEEEGEFGSPG